MPSKIDTLTLELRARSEQLGTDLNRFERRVTKSMGKSRRSVDRLDNCVHHFRQGEHGCF